MKMLQRFNALATFILVAVLFVGCSEGQTSMSIDDIQNRAKITGKLIYSEGQAFKNGEIIELIKPVAGKKVFVEVSNASLSPDGQAKGSTTFTGVTDENGDYAIEIPVAAKVEGTVISIKPETFEGKQSVLVPTDQIYPEFETKEVVYSYDSKTEVVKPNFIVVCDMMYESTFRETGTTVLEKIELTAKIGVCRLKKGDNYYSNIAYVDVQSGINVLFAVTHYNSKTGESVKRSYGGVTNKSGEVTVKIPVKEIPCLLGVELSANSFEVNDFIYYQYSGNDNTITYSGVYKQYNNRVFGKPVNFGDIMFNESGAYGMKLKSIMVFEPFEGQPYGYYFQDYNWSNLSF